MAKALVVQEWGVFHVDEDSEVANADVRAEWDSQPAFIYGNISGRVVPVNWGPAEFRRKPVVFFHSPQPLTVRMIIDFPGGKPATGRLLCKPPVSCVRRGCSAEPTFGQ